MTIFRVADGSMLADVPFGEQTQRGGQALNLDFSHDGRLLATANGSDVTVGIWSVPDLRLVSSFSINDGEFRAVASSVAFSPDDSRLVAGTGKLGPDVLVAFNVADGSRVWSRDVWSQDDLGCSEVGDVKFSPDGTELVEACLHGSNAILDAASGRLITVLGTASRGVGSVDYYDNDHILIGD
ncbi:MAG: hypothetical protein ABIQ16_08120 [Polyangiaceae bacterium]